ncbi:MAG: HEPN domain-containing protein [Fibromonadales bacterium]|nr:HEPN domain-containing protein [Fibromonadales bacterium]
MNSLLPMSDEVTSGKWITEAAGNIFQIVQDNFLYRNEIINRFIREEERRFVVAGKGMGKTLLLAYKRKILEEKYRSASLFIPKDNPYVGSMIKLRELTADVINYLKDFDHCKSLWLLAIELSALSQAAQSAEPSDAAWVHKWLVRAQDDLDTAKHLYSNYHPKKLEIICYLCQQATEKALKAYLTQNDFAFPFTHDCRKLCLLCAEQENSFREFVDDCVDLTPYAT